MTPSAGLSLKPQHFDAALDCAAEGLWFEIHPENYMVDGGPRLAWLERVRARHPLSLHGVGASLGADADPDPRHLARLAALCERLQPALVSEHLAWSAWRGVYHADLLPLPRTRTVLDQLVRNVGRMQDALGRTIAIENPSHYLRFDAHEYDEIDFLAELSRRSGCGLLFDVNNVHVGARNLGYEAATVIDRVPGELVREIHLAGHSADPMRGDALLIDSHDAPVAPEVWALYERLVTRIGPRPTLVERDDNIPSLAELLGERQRAQDVLRFAARLAA